jgi:phenylacetate-CoA ligase
MDLLRPIVARFTYDAFLRRDGYRLRGHRRDLAASQYFSADELQALQLERLKRTLTAAHATNAFYQDRFRACGFEPGDFRGFADLAGLPVLTKDDIRSQLAGRLSAGYRPERVLQKRTGGSTGVPVRIGIDFDAVAVKKAAAERHDAWAHRHPGDRLAAVWGDTSGPRPWRERLRNALTARGFYLDTLRFEPAAIDAFIARIRRLRPPVLMGHAHSVFRLAEHLREHGIADIGFRSVITTAMVLTEAERRTIEAVFRAPVFDRYGCEELSIIASECEAHCGLHIFAEGLYVELDGEREDQPRPLILTDLLNRAMPLIRYEVGDLGIAETGTCPCGRGLPRLREVSGRSADFLYTPDRVPVFGISILDTFVIHIPGIKQCQIVQDRYDHLDVYIVRDVGFTDESLARLGRNVVQIFGERMSYDVHPVTEIPQTERGKYRFSICRIEEGTAEDGPPGG